MLSNQAFNWPACFSIGIYEIISTCLFNIGLNGTRLRLRKLLGNTALHFNVGRRFLDPNALSLFDKPHSEGQEGWMTLGLDYTGVLLVVCRA